MSYRAEFLDGPMIAAVHEFMGRDDPYDDLFATPNPSSLNDPWLIIGYTGLEPEREWPDQVHYHLVGVFIHDGQTHADYSLLEKPE